MTSTERATQLIGEQAIRIRELEIDIRPFEVT